MNIIRDGKEISLTSSELYLAWEEKQRQYYTEDIEDEIRIIFDGMSEDEIIERYGHSEEEIRRMIPTIVNKYWDYNDSADIISEVQCENRKEAIGNVIRNWR